MRPALPILCLLLLVLGACQRAAAPWPHEAYVWQRHWDGELREALAASADTFAAFRVLAAETARDGSLQPIVPDLAALARERRPVTAVLRLDGSDPPPDAAALNAQMAAIVRDWRAAGVALVGIELDHDCASARLGDYARLVAAVRHELPSDLRLSVTALPTWTDVPALAALRAAADETVLQVHAVSAPARGLFDAKTAQRWVARYAAQAPQPFRVALPAYGVRVSFDDGGRALAVRAEMPREDAGADVRELAAAPDEVAALLAHLRATPPAGLRGVLWFRLPRSDDRRAWSLATLRAVIAQAPLSPQLAVRIEDAGVARDIVLANAGSIDAPLPGAVSVAAADCAAADAVNGFRLESAPGGWRFVADTASPLLRAGRERRIGWIHCAHVQKVSIDETP